MGGRQLEKNCFGGRRRRRAVLWRDRSVTVDIRGEEGDAGLRVTHIWDTIHIRIRKKPYLGRWIAQIGKDIGTRAGANLRPPISGSSRRGRWSLTQTRSRPRRSIALVSGLTRSAGVRRRWLVLSCVAVGHREDARMLLCWLCAGCVRVTLVYTLWAQREAGRGKIRLTLNLGVTLNSGRRIGVLISG